jgi:hypothetical protein
LLAAIVVACGGASGAFAQTASCSVKYTAPTWVGGNGFGASIDITNTGPSITGWTLAFSFPNGQRIQNGWPVSFAQATGSANVTAASNAPWNATLAPNTPFNIAFNGTSSGANNPPTSFTLNGTVCGGVGNTSPAVQVTAPTQGQTVPSSATSPFNATASDPGGAVVRVEFRLDGTLIATDTTAPYGITFNSGTLAAGSHTAQATAFDNGTPALSASHSVTFNIGGTANTPPTVNLTAPTNAQVFPAGTTSVNLAATATDPGGAVQRVEFRVGTTLVGTDMTSPYTATATGLTAGSFTATATAFDNGAPTPVLSAAMSVPFTISVTSGGVIPPSTPPASQVGFAINSTQDVRSISRFIYGLNGWDPSVRPANLTLSRSGGNRMTAYNWETNDSNAGADFQNQNDTFLGGGNVPNGAVKPGLEAARAAGAGMLVTMPLIGFVSADHNGGGDVALSGPNYLATRFRVSSPRKGAPFVLAPVTTDGFVYQDEYVNFLDKTYPGAFAAANNPIMISLDNEPDLWQSTHARLRGDGTVGSQAGTTATYAEMVQRTVAYADAAKDIVPAAQIFGPVNYGWQGMVRFQDAADHMNRDFLEFYLAQMAVAEATTGHRLVDVLDVHWYPEATGVNASGGTTRVTDDNIDAGVVAARKQAPRSLWDSTYTETSWITGCCSGGPIRLLPRLREKISANYPNTKLAITEYNYGGPNHISGGIAQADVLGVFGREGLYAATLWRLSATNSFIYGGFESFRNYDGVNGSFGDTSIRATNTDAAAASVYASVNAGSAGRMVIVAINKADTAQTAGIAVSHTVQFHTAQVYTLTSANPVPQRRADINITLTNAFQYSMPANSVTTLVLLP